MPMFDIESADKLKLRDCSTDSKTMVKATGKIGVLDAERCKVESALVVKPSFFRQVVNNCLSSTGQIVIGVCSILIGAFILAYFKL